MKHMTIADEEGGSYDDSNVGVELISRPYTALYFHDILILKNS